MGLSGIFGRGTRPPAAPTPLLAPKTASPVAVAPLPPHPPTLAPSLPLTPSHYTWHALSPSAKVVTVYVFRIVSFTFELFLFLYAGWGMCASKLWGREPEPLVSARMGGWAGVGVGGCGSGWVGGVGGWWEGVVGARVRG